MSATYRAGVVPLRVVAAKKPGHWIVRAIGPFTDVQRLVASVSRVVGVLDPDVEWTGYTYGGWPGYVVYGEADLPRLDWPTGVFRFDCKSEGGDVYGPAIRLGTLAAESSR